MNDPYGIADLLQANKDPYGIADLLPKKAKVEEGGFVSSVERGFNSTVLGGHLNTSQKQGSQTDFLDELDKYHTELDWNPAAVKPNPRNYKDVPKEWANLDPNARTAARERLNKSIKETGKQLGERIVKDKTLPRIPEYDDYNKSKTIGEAIDKALASPIAVGKGIIGESLGAQVPTLPLNVAGGALGKYGFAASAGATSGMTEYASSIQDILNDMKVNLTDEAAVKAAMKTPEFQDRATKKLGKAAVIGIMDAIGAGVAVTPLFKSKVADIATKVGVGMTTGATGEIAGSAVAGEEVKPAAVLSEIIGEVPGSIKDIAAGAIANHFDTQKAKAEQDAAVVKGKLDSIISDALAAAKTTPEAPTPPQAPTPPAPVQEPTVGLPSDPEESENPAPVVKPADEPTIPDAPPVEPLTEPTLQTTPTVPDKEPSITGAQKNADDEAGIINTGRTVEAVKAEIVEAAQSYNETSKDLISKLRTLNWHLEEAKKGQNPFLIESTQKQIAATQEHIKTRLEEFKAQIERLKKERDTLLAPPNPAAPTKPVPSYSKEDVDRIPTVERAARLKVLKDVLGKSGKASDLADFLAKLGPSPMYQQIATKVAEMLRLIEGAGQTTKVELVTLEDAAKDPDTWRPGIRGHVDFANGETTIRIRQGDAFWNNGINFTTTLHETIHGALVVMMRSYKDNPDTLGKKSPQMLKNIRDLEKLLKTIQRRAKQDLNDNPDALPFVMKSWLKENNNALNNIDELLAWGLSNYEFQEYLKSIPYKTGNLFTAFIQKIKQLLGIEIEDTAFGKLLSVFDDMTDPNYFNNIDWRSDISNEAVNAASPTQVSAHFQFPAGPTVTTQDVVTATNTFEDMLRVAGRLNNVPVPLPYAQAQADIVAAAQTGQQPPIVTSINPVDLLNYLQGQQVAQSPAPGPFMTLGNRIIVAIDNRQLMAELQSSFPNREFMTPWEAKTFVSTGKTMKEAHAKWEDGNKQLQLLKLLPKPSLAQLPQDLRDKLKNLSEFDDIDDPLVAKQELINRGKDLFQTLTNYLTGGPTTKAVLTNNPVIRWLRGAIDKAVASQATLSKERIVPISKFWHGFNRQEKNEVMYALLQADENQIDLTTQMLQQAGMTPAQVDFINMVYDSNRWLIDTWNQKRIALGQEPIPIRPGHFPGIFDGDYQIVATVNDQVVGVMTADSKLGLEWKKHKLSQLMPNVVWGPQQRMPLAGQGHTKMNMFDAYDQIAKALGTSNPDVQAFLGNVLKVGQSYQANLFAFHVHGLGKKGVIGSEGRHPWQSDKQNADDAFGAFIQYLEQGVMHHELLPTLNSMNELITDPTMRNKFPNTVRYLESYYRHITRHEPETREGSLLGRNLHSVGYALDSIIDTALSSTGLGPSVYRKGMAGLRSVFATMAMGMFNLAFTALQFAQVPTMALQAVQHIRTQMGVPFYKGRMASVTAVMGLFRYFMEHTLNKGKPINGLQAIGGDEETRLAFAYAETNNLINFTDIDRAIEATISPKAAAADKVLNANQRFAEGVTRPFVFMWVFKMARSAGMPMSYALEQAKNATQFVMVNYRSENRPMVYSALGSLGTAMGQLKTFAHSAAAQESFWVKKFVQNPTKDWKPLATTIAMYLAVMGLESAPGFDELDELIKRINVKYNGKVDGLKEITVKHLPEWVNKGIVSHVSNIDFQSRLRMPPFIQMDVLANIPAFSWLTGQVKAISEYGKTPDKQREINMMREVAPSSIKGPIEAHFYRDKDNNLMDRQGTVKFKMTDREWELRNWGFRSVDQTRREERYREGLEDKDFNKNRVKTLAKELVELTNKNEIGTAVYNRKMSEYIERGGAPKSIYKQAGTVAKGRGTPQQERAIGKSIDTENMFDFEPEYESR